MSNGPGDIVVRVGAVLDRSFDVVMGDVEKKAERANRAARQKTSSASPDAGAIQSAQLTSKQLERIARDTKNRELAIQRDMYRERSAMERLFAREKMRAEAAATRAATSAARSRTRERIQLLNTEERAQRDHEARLLRMKIQSAKELNSAKRAADRASYRDSLRRDREAERFASRTSHRATRFFFPPPEGAIGYAKRTALDIARGAGIDFSVSSGVSKARDNEMAATALSGQGWNPDKLGFDERIKPEELRAISKAQAFRLMLSGEGDVLAGMTKFTDVTGDLETAKSIIGDIGLLARATGTDLSSAAAAAADMSAQLPDDMAQEQRRATMSMLLNVAAMQGKRGAVEVKDLARYVPRIAAQAQAFGGTADSTMVQLLATAQIARRFGGAGNAAQAATSVQAMVNTLKTPARVKAFRAQFKDAGLSGEHGDIYDKNGQLRSIQAIIKDSIVAASVAKDPQIAFKKMWGNVLGAKAPEGLRNVFAKAGGGKAGLDAVDAEFAKFTAALNPEAQERLLASIADTTEAKANRFQQSLDRVSERIAQGTLPSLERLEPSIISAANAFASVVSWSAENPGKMISLAIVGSIARAGIESGIRLLIDKAAVAVLSGGSISSLFAGKGALAALGTGAGLVAGLAAIAAASFTATTALLQLADASNQKEKNERIKSANEIYFEGAQNIGNASDPLARRQAYEEARKRIIDADNKVTGNKLTGEGRVSPQARNALRSLADAYDKRNTLGSAEQRNMQTLATVSPAHALTPNGAGISNEQLGRAFAQMLTGNPIQVVVKNFDDMPNMTPADGFSGGPSRFFQ